MEGRNWIALQNATLADAHASWFRDIPEELLARAKTTPLGRRWMAGWLAAGHPIFRQPASGLGDDDVLREHEWLCRPLAARLDFMLELAALALAPLLRAQVTREIVRRLRATLGEGTYQRMLHSPVRGCSAAASGESDLFASEAALKEGLLRQAAIELSAFARDLHPALEARVCLVFSEAVPALPASAQLSRDAVIACERYCHGNGEK